MGLGEAENRPWGRSEGERRRILGEASSLQTFQKLTGEFVIYSNLTVAVLKESRI